MPTTASTQHPRTSPARASRQGFYFLCELASPKKFSNAPDGSLVDGEWFQCAVVGTWYSPVYGKVTISPDDLKAMLSNFRASERDEPSIPVDYDHLGDDPQKPGDGKAAGWITDLQLRSNGGELWAKPEWTVPAAKMLAAREYRYCSPFFVTDFTDKITGKNAGASLRAVALTNRPFLESLDPIPAPAIAASDKSVRGIRFSPLTLNSTIRARSTEPGSVRTPQGSHRHTSAKRSIAMKEQSHQPAPPVGEPEETHLEGSEVEGREMEGADAPSGLTCPHCGAPVRHHVAPKAEENADHEEGGVEGDDPGAVPTGTAMEGGDPEAEGEHAPQTDADLDGDGDGAEHEDGDGMADPPPNHVPPVHKHNQPPPAAFSDRKALLRRLANVEAALAETQSVLRTRQRSERRAYAEQLLSRGVRDGKVTPKLAGTAEKPGWAREFAFRDPGGFKKWLAGAPRLIEFGERGTSLTDASDTAASTAEKIAALAKAEMEKDAKLTYADATKKVLGENRALSERYDSEMIGQRETSPQRQNVRRL